MWKVLPRSIQILLKKEDSDKGFWERLLKDKQQEKTNVKVSSTDAYTGWLLRTLTRGKDSGTDPGYDKSRGLTCQGGRWGRGSLGVEEKGEKAHLNPCSFRRTWLRHLTTTTLRGA